MPIQDSVVVVTGGSSGIGLALVREVLGKGAKGVALTGRTKEKLDKVAEELLTEFGVGRVIGVPCNATSWEDNVNLMKKTNDTYGQIDYVFANATGQEDGPLLTLFSGKPDYSDALSMLNSVAYTVHAALPYLASSGSEPVSSYEAAVTAAKEGGKGKKRDRAIFVTGSEAPFAGLVANPAYSAGKAAMAGMVWSIAERLEQVGVRINCLAPGWIETPLVQEILQLGTIKREDIIPMEQVVGAFMRFVDDTTLNGVVTRMAGPEDAPIDVPAGRGPSFSFERWGPFLEAREKAANAAA